MLIAPGIRSVRVQELPQARLAEDVQHRTTHGELRPGQPQGVDCVHRAVHHHVLAVVVGDWLSGSEILVLHLKPLDLRIARLDMCKGIALTRDAGVHVEAGLRRERVVSGLPVQQEPLSPVMVVGEVVVGLSVAGSQVKVLEPHPHPLQPQRVQGSCSLLPVAPALRGRRQLPARTERKHPLTTGQVHRDSREMCRIRGAGPHPRGYTDPRGDGPGSGRSRSDQVATSNHAILPVLLLPADAILRGMRHRRTPGTHTLGLPPEKYSNWFFFFYFVGWSCWWRCPDCG